MFIRAISYFLLLSAMNVCVSYAQTADQNVETRASKACAGWGNITDKSQGNVTIDNLSIKSDGKGTITVYRDGVDLGHFSNGTFDQYTACLIEVIKLISPQQPIPSSPLPTLKVFSLPNVQNEGVMHDIKVTIIPDGHGSGSYNIEFRWSGGTWSGSQTTTITFIGSNNGSLQSVVVAIDRSGCFYGGGNWQKLNGQLTVNPEQITGATATLSEVHNRKEGGC